MCIHGHIYVYKCMHIFCFTLFLFFLDISVHVVSAGVLYIV